MPLEKIWHMELEGQQLAIDDWNDNDTNRKNN
jgi:hypothetical protein